MGGKISIVVPVYNTVKYLDRCVQSVLSQDYDDYEMLLIDDGSAEPTASACDAYASANEKIICHHKPNGGQLSTRIMGIEKAAGDYIMFLDSDDALAPHALRTAAEGIERLGCDILFYGFCKMKGEEVFRMSAEDSPEPEVIGDKREIYLKVFCDPSYNAMWRKICRREMFGGEQYEDFRHLRCAEDLLQSIDIYKRASSVGFIGDRLYLYYLNGDSVSHTIKYKMISDDFAVYGLLTGFLKSENVFGPEDFGRFYTVCAAKTARHAEKIARSDAGRREKKEMLARLRGEEFFANLASSDFPAPKGHEGILFSLLRRKRFGFVLFYCSVVSGLRKIREKL